MFEYVILNTRILRMNDDGEMWGYMKGKKEWLLIENNGNNNGYNQISCGGKLYRRHRVLACVFLGLDINDPKSQVDHIDCNKLNNSLENLRIVSNQQNQWNRKDTKGYCWYERYKKFQANICLNGKHIHLGYFDNEDDARQAYITAKEEHHIFTSRA